MNNFLKDYKENLMKIWNELQNSSNKVYTVIKHKNSISGFFAIIALISGTLGFLIEGIHLFGAIEKSFGLFGFNYPDGASFESNFFIFIASISAVIAVFFLAVIFFIRDFLDNLYIKKIMSTEHTVLFGLGEINRSFLNSIKQVKNQSLISKILIIENDPKNKYIEEYKEIGYGVLVGDALSDNILEKLEYKNLKNAIIAMGEDRHNIEFAKQFMDKYDADNEIKLIIHIENKDLEILFYSNFINKKDSLIQIKTFSFYEEVAKDLFSKHYIDGDSDKYINSSDEFKTIIIGDGQLFEKILYQIALISHLPNENMHTIYLVDKEADKLFIKIKKSLYYKQEKDSFPTLQIIPVSLDQNRLEFYSDTIWNEDNLVNVIVAFDEEGRNLDTAVDLYNRIYLQKAIDKETMPKILFGIYEEMLLSCVVNDDKVEFNNFYTYGNVNYILSYDELIDEESDKIAKLINNGYGYEYDKQILGQDNINKKWHEKDKFSDKLSNIAQAKHIDMKLKSMGLKKIKYECSNYNKNNLLEANQKLILEKVANDRKKIGLEEEDLIKYSKELEKFWHKQPYKIMYFPKDFDTLFEKMIRMEHNRWNTYHYLNGWKHAEEKVKPKKEHDCLLALKDFDKDSIQITVIYDIYSFLYLPNYLAETGYKIVEYNKN